MLLFLLESKAQQEPMYSQYMFNTVIINPAYAGSREALSATILYRNQWLGIDGAPVTQTFNIHNLLKNEKIGLGLSMTNDSYTIHSHQNVNLCFAYILNLGSAKLSFGLQAGAVRTKSDFSKINFAKDEQIEVGQSVQKIAPSFGTGLYLHSEKFYFGLSCPRIATVSKSQNPLELKLIPHYYAMLGINFYFSENLIFRPSTLIKHTTGSPLQADFNTFFLYNNTIGAGLAYRTTESLIGMIQVHLGKIKIGYSYDYGVGALSRIANGSHEIFINFETTLIKDKVVSPRFF